MSAQLHLRYLSSRFFALLFVLLVSACATSSLPPGGKEMLRDPAANILIGVTSKVEVAAKLGKATEVHDEDDGGQVWIYRDAIDVPFLLSMIPIVGDIADVVALMHKNRELIVTFDQVGVVTKWRLRPLG